MAIPPFALKCIARYKWCSPRMSGAWGK